jgi:hypothetical protein
VIQSTRTHVRRRRPRDGRAASGVERLRDPHQYSQVRFLGFIFLSSEIGIQTEIKTVFKIIELRYFLTKSI